MSNYNNGGNKVVGAGWKVRSRNGLDYIRLKINQGVTIEGGVGLNMFPNRNKATDNQPDYLIFFPKSFNRQEEYTPPQEPAYADEEEENPFGG